MNAHTDPDTALLRGVFIAGTGCGVVLTWIAASALCGIADLIRWALA